MTKISQELPSTPKSFKIHTVVQMGDYHFNHCEDYLFVGEIGDDKLLCAVMDGCTMAIDSYFISTMVGKLLRKIAKEKGYSELYGLENTQANLDDLLKSILDNLFRELKAVKNQLMLEPKEMLTTLIISLIDKKKDQGIILVIGDGVISINGEITEFDQENKPDYLGFHLAEDFEEWYAKQIQKVQFDTIKDISIATDGITQFSAIAKNTTDDTIDPIDYLLLDLQHKEDAEMLTKKVKSMEHQFGLKPTDDLAIVRLIHA